jgi:hypothetical protein
MAYGVANPIFCWRRWDAKEREKYDHAIDWLVR